MGAVRDWVRSATGCGPRLGAVRDWVRSATGCGPRQLLKLFRNHWSVENSLHHVKDRSWDEDVPTLRRPGLGDVYATLLNTGLNALRLEGWFPPSMSMPLRAKSCVFRPTQTIDRLYGRAS